MRVFFVFPPPIRTVIGGGISICIVKAPEGALSLIFLLRDLCAVTDDADRFFHRQILSQILFGDKALYLVDFHTVGLGELFEFSLNFFRCGLNFFQLGNLFKSQANLDLLLSLGLEVVANRVLIHTGILQVGIEVQTLRLQAICEVAQIIVDLVLVQSLGNFTLQLFYQLVDQLSLNLILGSLLTGFQQIFADILFISFQRIELADVFCKIIVNGRQLFLFDFMQLDLKYGLFVLESGSLIILREGYGDIELFAGGVADNLLLKARDKLAGAKIQRVVLRLAAFKGNAVYETFKIDDSRVAELSRTIAPEPSGFPCQCPHRLLQPESWTLQGPYNR